MSMFPQLGDLKLITGLPYRVVDSFDTVVSQVPNGRQFAFSRRANPLKRFEINLPVVTDAERDSLESFLSARGGQLESFDFLDPGGNLVEFSEDFSDSTWTKSSVSVGAAQTDPFGRSKATRLTSTGDGHITTSVLPSGGASGFRLCMSAWLKALTDPQTLRLSFRDTGELAGVDVSVPLTWKRFSFSFELATSNAISIRFGGNSTWGSNSIDFFGAQCAPMIGPGAYTKSPANLGRHTCRLESGPEVVRLGPDQNSVRLTLREVSA